MIWKSGTYIVVLGITFMPFIAHVHGIFFSFSLRAFVSPSIYSDASCGD
jgi:hypothetical protein